MKILHTNVGCKNFQSTLHVVNGCLNGNPKHLKFGLINNMFLEQILKKKKNLSKIYQIGFLIWKNLFSFIFLQQPQNVEYGESDTTRECSIRISHKDIIIIIY